MCACACAGAGASASACVCACHRHSPLEIEDSQRYSQEGKFGEVSKSSEALLPHEAATHEGNRPRLSSEALPLHMTRQKSEMRSSTGTLQQSTSCNIESARKMLECGVSICFTNGGPCRTHALRSRRHACKRRRLRALLWLPPPPQCQGIAPAPLTPLPHTR